MGRRGGAFFCHCIRPEAPRVVCLQTRLANHGGIRPGDAPHCPCSCHPDNACKGTATLHLTKAGGRRRTFVSFRDADGKPCGAFPQLQLFRMMREWNGDPSDRIPTDLPGSDVDIRDVIALSAQHLVMRGWRLVVQDDDYAEHEGSEAVKRLESGKDEPEGEVEEEKRLTKRASRGRLSRALERSEQTDREDQQAGGSGPPPPPRDGWEEIGVGQRAKRPGWFEAVGVMYTHKIDTPNYQLALFVDAANDDAYKWAARIRLVQGRKTCKVSGELIAHGEHDGPRALDEAMATAEVMGRCAAEAFFRLHSGGGLDRGSRDIGFRRY